MSSQSDHGRYMQQKILQSRRRGSGIEAKLDQPPQDQSPKSPQTSPEITPYNEYACKKPLSKTPPPSNTDSQREVADYLAQEADS